MTGFNSFLKPGILDWLLEENNPSVRYYTLTKLLDQPVSSPEVVLAKNRIMQKGLVPEILSKQAEDGSWGNPKSFYLDKYKGTVWQLIILAEFGADCTDNRILNSCNFIAENSQDYESGGFAINSSSKGGGRHSEVIPCLSGNMVWCLLKLGFPGQSKIQSGLDYILSFQRFDDGIQNAPKGWPYDKFEMCFGEHSCHMGIVKSLKALAEVPVNKRTKLINDTIEKGVEFILIHNIFKKSHNLKQKSKPGWLKLGFPLMYQTDILEILNILTKLGIKDKRMDEAIDIIISKQGQNGKWLLENTFNGRYHVNIEIKNKPGKWITLNALKVLKRYYQ